MNLPVILLSLSAIFQMDFSDVKPDEPANPPTHEIGTAIPVIDVL
jgi:hypothetical protein